MKPGATSVVVFCLLLLLCSLKVCHGKIKSFTVTQLTTANNRLIQETDEVALVCDTDDELSRIEIKRLQDKATVNVSQVGERSLRYVIKTVSCSDMGSYECVQDSTQRLTADLVIVKCPPQPCDGADVLKTIFVNESGNVNFSVCVLAAGNISTFAVFNGELVRKKNLAGWTWDYERIVYPVPSTSRFHVHVKRDQVDAEMYGLLLLTIFSDQGQLYNISFNFILNKPGPPDCPTNFTVIDRGHDYVIISWVPGLDGGSRQTFTVYQSTDKHTWHSSGVNTESSTVNVTGLSSNTSYYLRVVSLNRYRISYDASICQETVSVTTTHSFIQPAKVFDDDNKGPDILILTVSFCSLLVILLLAAFVCWRRVNRGQMVGRIPRKGTAETPDTGPGSSLGEYFSDDGLKYTTVYPVHDHKRKRKKKRKNDDKIQYATLDFVNTEMLSQKTATK